MSRLKHRRAARARAFQALYGISFAKVPTELALRSAFTKTPSDDEADAKPEGFAWDLVYGVWSHAAALDEVISRFSHHWRVDRMGRVEITLLRLAVYEMLYREDIPPKVAINEALELAKQFGEDNARAFVNGILDAVARTVERGELTAQTDATAKAQ